MTSMQPSKRMDRKVTALITAESIIVGFLAAYATLVNSTLVYWSERGGQIFTTVFAGLLIYAMMLTAFRSVHLLFRSIDTDDPENEDYRAGYDLFLIVLFGSGIYVLMNAASVVHFSMTGANVPIPDERLSISIAASFFAGWVSCVVIAPVHLTKCVRCSRNKLGDPHFGLLVFLLDDMEKAMTALVKGLVKSFTQLPQPLAKGYNVHLRDHLLVHRLWLTEYREQHWCDPASVLQRCASEWSKKPCAKQP